jgi:CheY-like chemotaxis protein
VASVLLVDDDDAVRDVLRESFEHAGYDVRAFPEAVGALRALTETPPDLIVTDWQMRGLNGAHIVSTARELQAHVPIVVVSGHLQHAKEGVDPADPNLYLFEKPFSIASLLELADRLTA